MIKHKIFTKGELIQALISTTQAPNVLIPVRAMIHDVKFNDVNPQYQIKIRKFYDQINFLKRYLIVVDSVFCVKTKAEQDRLFNKIQDFQIEANIKDLFNLSNRTLYSGNFNFHTKGEFVKALQKFLGDKYPKDDDWVDSVLYRPNHDEMDRGEWV